jgi:hypothetical protein
MTTRPLPDLEDALVEYLLGVPELTDIVDDHIYGPELPAEPAYPLVQVTIISGRAATHHWIGQALIQVDGWCTRNFTDPRATAREACEAAVAALHDARNVEVGDCLLGSAEDVRTPSPRPDPDTSNRRYLAEVLITYHPASLAS